MNSPELKRLTLLKPEVPINVHQESLPISKYEIKSVTGKLPRGGTLTFGSVSDFFQGALSLIKTTGRISVISSVWNSYRRDWVFPDASALHKTLRQICQAVSRYPGQICLPRSPGEA